MAACHARNGNIKWGTRDNKAKRVQWTLVAHATGAVTRARQALAVRATSAANFVNVFLSRFFADLLYCMMSLQILSSHQCVILLNLLKMR